MKNLFYIIALFAFLNPMTMSAQINRCGTDEYHAEKMKDPVFAQKFRALDRLVREQSKYRSPSCTDPIIIPVAVHWNGNITSAGADMSCLMTIIDKQIDILNEDFGGYNSDIINYCNHSSNCPTEFPPNSIGGGTCVQFCIATENHPASANLNNGDYAMTFGQYEFPPQSQTTPEAPDWAGYVNFFVSDVSPPGYNNLLGLAPLNGGANPNGNGIFVTSNSFGGDNYSCISSGVTINGSANYGLGRTATHEAGHYFNLKHVFTTDDQNATPADPCVDSDDISDTPIQYIANFGGKTINYTTCTSDAHNTCGTQDFFFDYMDYGDDDHLYMFTSEQSDVINASATTGTSSANPYKTAATTCATTPANYMPTYSTGCPVATPPESAFSINATAPYEFCPAMNEISFTDESTNFPTTWLWEFSGAGVTPSTSTDQNPVIQVNSNGTLMVTLTTSNNGGGADLSPEVKNYNITIKPPAQCGNCGESFFDTGGMNGNYGNNEDMVWTLCAADPGDVVSVTFTSIDFGTVFFEDKLWIKEGQIAATNDSDADYVVTKQALYTNTGGNNWSGTPAPVTVSSCEACYTFRLITSAADTYPGWEADVTCSIAATCTDGIQNQGEEFVDCGNMNNGCETCNTCPTACEGFTFYDNGGPANPTGSAQQTWTICADNTDEHVTLDFTTIDMLPFNNGILQVFEGTSTSVPYTYYISGTGIYDSDGSGGIDPHGSASITSTGQCFSFVLFGGSETSNGWEATVSSDCTLPISLNTFTAEAIKNTIELNWETAAEINSDKFVLQRGVQRNSKTKSTEFQDISTIDACGNCFNSNYQYVDIDVIAGFNYTYRLKMVDRDGKTEYSPIVYARIEEAGRDWNIYPNPGKGLFTLELSQNHTYNKVELVDKLGRKVFQKSISSLDKTLSLDFDHLEAGYYQLILEGTHTVAKPIIILP